MEEFITCYSLLLPFISNTLSASLIETAGERKDAKEEKVEERKAEKRTGGGMTTDCKPVPEVDPGPGLDPRPQTGPSPAPGPGLGTGLGTGTGPGPTGVQEDPGKSTEEKGVTVSQQHTLQSEPSDQRTEPHLSDKHMD